MTLQDTALDARHGDQAAAAHRAAGAGLVVRIGLPRPTGALVHEALRQGHAAMVSAAAFIYKGELRVPRADFTLEDIDWALDSAGFTAMTSWKTKGAQRGMLGIFPWSLQAYAELAWELKPTWWSAPDLCCEREIARDRQEVAERQTLTTHLLRASLEWTLRRRNALVRAGWSESMVLNEAPAPVPILQGATADDYVRHLHDTLLVVEDYAHLWPAGVPPLVGIGSMCRRALHDASDAARRRRGDSAGLLDVIGLLDRFWPRAIGAHLFGVKGAALDDVRRISWVRSIDSMAWDVGSRREAFELGESNDTARRARHMNRWSERARERADAPTGCLF